MNGEKSAMLICDAIQQKVHNVGKLVFPNEMEIGKGDRKEHLKKISGAGSASEEKYFGT